MKFNTPYDRDLSFSIRAEKGGGRLLTDSSGNISSEEFFYRVKNGIITSPYNRSDFDTLNMEEDFDSLPSSYEDEAPDVVDLVDLQDAIDVLKRKRVKRGGDFVTKPPKTPQKTPSPTEEVSEIPEN